MDWLLVALLAVTAFALLLVARQLPRARRAEARSTERLHRLATLASNLVVVEPGPDSADRIADLAAETAGAAGGRLLPPGAAAPHDRQVATVVLRADATDLGTLAFRFDGGSPRDAPTLAFLRTIGAQCSQTLRRLRFQEADRDALAHVGLLANAAMRVSASLDVDAVEAALIDIAVPLIADKCEISRGEPSEAAPAGAGRFPLQSRGRTVGYATFSRRGRPLDSSEHGIAQQLSAVAASALDNALLFEEQASASQILQRSLLPRTLLAVPRLQISARYVAAAPTSEVGGDFYDTVCLPGGATMLFIGDVQGKGVEAASLTSVARHTLRSGALEGAGPVEMLKRANRAVRYDETEAAAAEPDRDDRFMTAAVVHLTPCGEGFHVVAASAGHPPPIVVRANGTVELLDANGLLLGMADDPPLHEAETDLALADTVVLYTDGVTDQRRVFFDETELGQLLRHRIGVVDADAVAQLVLDTVLLMAPEVARDDLAIVVATVTRDERGPIPQP